MKIPKFNPKIFFFAAIICGAITFIAAVARNENTGGDGIRVLTLERLFYILAFPVNRLFLLLRHINSSTFFVGHVLNFLVNAVIVERIFSYYKMGKLQ